MTELSFAERALLLSLAPHGELRAKLEQPLGVLSDNDVDLAVELATDRLLTSGFNGDRPTAEGAALERLIDRLVDSLR